MRQIKGNSEPLQSQQGNHIETWAEATDSLQNFEYPCKNRGRYILMQWKIVVNIAATAPISVLPEEKSLLLAAGLERPNKYLY